MRETRVPYRDASAEIKTHLSENLAMRSHGDTLHHRLRGKRMCERKSKLDLNGSWILCFVDVGQRALWIEGSMFAICEAKCERQAQV